MATKAEMEVQIERLQRDLNNTRKKYGQTLQYLYDAIRPQYALTARTDVTGNRTYVEKLERTNNFNGFSGPDDHPIRQYLKDALKNTEVVLGIQPETTIGSVGWSDWNVDPELPAARHYRKKYRLQWDDENHCWIDVKKVWVDREGNEVEGYEPSGHTHYYNPPFEAWVPVTETQDEIV